MFCYLQLRVTQGQGRFIPTPCYAEKVYGRIEAREVVSCLYFMLPSSKCKINAWWKDVSHSFYYNVNPYLAELLIWNNPPYFLGTVHYHFRDIKMKT